MQFLIFLLLIPVFWVLILRPQQQQRRMHQEVVAGLAVGDKVMTVGGLIGTLTEVGPDTVRLDSGDGHELTFGRTFVRSPVPEPTAELTADDGAIMDEHDDQDQTEAGVVGDGTDRPGGLAS